MKKVVFIIVVLITLSSICKAQQKQRETGIQFTAPVIAKDTSHPIKFTPPVIVNDKLGQKSGFKREKNVKFTPPSIVKDCDSMVKFIPPVLAKEGNKSH